LLLEPLKIVGYAAAEGRKHFVSRGGGDTTEEQCLQHALDAVAGEVDSAGMAKKSQKVFGVSKALFGGAVEASGVLVAR
jgi:hypothetical protein